MIYSRDDKAGVLEMSASVAPEKESLVSYASITGGLKPEELESEIDRIWQAKIKTVEGRAQIAAALGVAPGDLVCTKARPPLTAPNDQAGFFGADLVVVVHWAVVNLIVPVFVGLAKDVIKDKLLNLWNDVIKKEINKDGDKFGDELTKVP